MRMFGLFEWLPWVRARRSRELANELRAHLDMAEADRTHAVSPRATSGAAPACGSSDSAKTCDSPFTRSVAS